MRQLAAVALVGSCAWLVLGVTRGDLGGTPGLSGLVPVAAIWLTATAAWAWLVHTVPDDRADRLALGTAVAARLAVWPGAPNLSDDVWRYLWDGRLLVDGRDPYAATPREVARAAGGEGMPWPDLWPLLNSPDHISVYPPVAQVPNAVAAWLGTTAPAQALVLKALALGADLATVGLLIHLTARWRLPARTPWIFALSPLVLVELTGQAHTEVWALPLLLLALRLLDGGRAAAAGLALAASVGAKLVPALALPFLVRRTHGAARGRLLGAAVAGIAVLLGPVVLAGDGPGVLRSLRLYVRVFSFADFLPGLASPWLGPSTGVVLGGLTAALLLLLAASEARPTVRSLPRTLAFAWGGWLLLSPTQHPWYVTPVLAWTALGGLRFGVAWAALAPATYAAYWGADGIAEVPWIVTIQGLVVGALFVADGVRALPSLATLAHGGGLARALVARTLAPRARLKRDLLLPHLHRDDAHLDLGCGTGALCAALRADGFDVIPADVQDASFLPDVRPLVYDGRRLPLPDASVDTVLLVTVLHHAPDPDAVLREAVRVARRRLVVMEDVWTNPVQRWLTLRVDALVNLELRGHPHTNRDEAGWAATFARLGLEVRHALPRRTAGLFRQILYVLELPARDDERPRSAR
ncbi:MAG: class I SAM-dependent methyltransferase [Alphaproteobacteria bacterium]|nr:class I SAM-dependent methyltransferase [Alphaproteobacteria bacterium]